MAKKTTEMESALDVSLRDLMRTLRRGQEEEADGLLRAVAVAKHGRDEESRFRVLMEHLAVGQEQLTAARNALMSVQQALSVLLGPPPKIEREDVRKVLEQLRSVDGEIRRSVQKYTAQGGAIPDANDVDFWEGFRVAAEKRTELLAERSRLSDEFVELIFRDDDRWLDLCSKEQE